MRLMITTALLLLATSSFAKAPADKSVVETPVAVVETAVVPAVAATADPVAVGSDKIDGKKESEIPLNLNAPKKASEDSHPIFKIILIFSLMGLVATGGFIYLRKYSKNNFAAGKNNQIKVLTQHYLGPKKSLAIIRVAGESILIGITDNNINMIKSLALLDDEVPEEVHSSNFADLFGGIPTTSTRTKSAEASEEPEEEEFSIRGVKDVVSKKLKGMRSFQ